MGRGQLGCDIIPSDDFQGKRYAAYVLAQTAASMNADSH